MMDLWIDKYPTDDELGNEIQADPFNAATNLTEDFMVMREMLQTERERVRVLRDKLEAERETNRLLLEHIQLLRDHMNIIEGFVLETTSFALATTAPEAGEDK